jgi:head-tail adaptor
MACKCSDYTAGMLREAVSFERLLITADGAGGTNSGRREIVLLSPTRAHVKSVSGREVMRTDRVDAETRLKVVVRYFEGLLESDSIVFRTRRHTITWINNVEFADKWLEISVDGGAANGGVTL